MADLHQGQELRDPSSPVVIGLTGNIACGKSTVVQMLVERGASSIDGDIVYHKLIEPEAPLWHVLHRRYGNEILAADDTIDRRALGAFVFQSQARMAELDRLTHPAIVDAIRDLVRQSEAPVIVIDAVKLVESGLDVLCDALWIVTCDEGQQVERLIARNQLSPVEARRRLAAQPNLESKLDRADVIVRNVGTLAATRRQVAHAWDSTIAPIVMTEPERHPRAKRTKR